MSLMQTEPKEEVGMEFATNLVIQADKGGANGSKWSSDRTIARTRSTHSNKLKSRDTIHTTRQRG